MIGDILGMEYSKEILSGEIEREVKKTFKKIRIDPMLSAILISLRRKNCFLTS